MKTTAKFIPLGLTINGPGGLDMARKIRRLIYINFKVNTWFAGTKDGIILEISSDHSRATRERILYFARGSLAALQS